MPKKKQSKQHTEQAFLPLSGVPDLEKTEESTPPATEKELEKEVKSPSMDAWRELYDYAQQIKELAPWEWVIEEDLFALVDPVAQETTYCMIMGQGGEHLAVAFYLGDDGLRSLLDAQDNVFDPFHVYFSQKCLALSFEDREFVTARDREVYKALGLKFRGRNQYPLFRHHDPGYEPWYLDEEQAAFLQISLPKVIEVLSEAQDDPDYFLLDDDKIRCFTPVASENKWKWEESAIEIDPPAPEIFFPKLNELEVHRFLKECGKGNAVLEIDYFFFPSRILDREKPYYPRLVMVADTMGPIVALSFATPEDNIYETVQQQLCAAMEQMKQAPASIHVQREDVATMLEHYAPLLGFDIHLVEELTALEEAKEGLLLSLSGDQGPV